MTEVKPCPFCGKKPIAEYNMVIAGKATEWHLIACRNAECGIKPSTDWHKNKNVVVNAWNRRAGDE